MDMDEIDKARKEVESWIDDKDFQKYRAKRFPSHIYILNDFQVEIEVARAYHFGKQVKNKDVK